jgi:UDP-glucose 4-epimerase
MQLLIPGGARYIGSHMVKYAQNQDHEVVVRDDFETGHEWAVKKSVKFYGLIYLIKTGLLSALRGATLME